MKFQYLISLSVNLHSKCINLIRYAYTEVLAKKHKEQLKSENDRKPFFIHKIKDHQEKLRIKNMIFLIFDV